MKKPKVGNISGLSTVISLKQIRPNHNPRSTIGTFTNIGSHLRSLMAIAGKCSCPCCGKLIAQGKKLNPAIFEKIYDPLFSLKPDKSTDSTKENATFPPSSMVKTYPEGTEKKVKDILTHCVSYLKDNTSYISTCSCQSGKNMEISRDSAMKPVHMDSALITNGLSAVVLPAVTGYRKKSRS